MDIHFLGTTGYHPNEQQHTMCVMIPELGLVFDAGTGMFRVRDCLQTSQLKILLSHAHLDHVLGLTFLFDILYGRQCQVEVIGMPDKLAAIGRHLFSEPLFPVAPPYRDVSLPQADAVSGSWEVCPGIQATWFPVQHPGDAVGYRLDFPDGKSLAYVTDTTASVDADYLQYIQQVDLLIHECYFPDGLEDLAAKTGHSCLTPVIQVAEKVQAGKVALIHLNPLQQWAPNLSSLGADYSGPPVVIPHDRQVLSFPPN